MNNTKQFKALAVAMAVLFGIVAPANMACAQHSDVLLQSINDRLVTGIADFDAGGWTLGDRVYAQEFPSLFFTNQPGWNSIGAGSPSMPPGASALPGLTAVTWNFLPMTAGSTTSNLLYWDGQGDVAFGPTPTAAYEFALRSRDGMYYAAAGESVPIAGATAFQTGDNGAVHEHEIATLDDFDGSLQTDPADGIYLVALQLTMEGRDRAAPIYWAYGTPGSTFDALVAARDWVNGSVDLLTPDDPEDANGDQQVDALDLAAWQSGFGTVGSAALQVAGDFTFDDAIDGADLLAWQRAYRSESTPSGATQGGPTATHAVPEPASYLLTGLCFAALLGWRFYRQIASAQGVMGRC